MPSNFSTFERHCQNCNTVLQGKFCHSCGQKDVNARRPAWDLPVQFIKDTFNVEGRFFRSLNYLFFRPGKLAAEFLSGKRAKFHEPVKMYLLTSFIFFIAAATLFNKAKTSLGSRDIQLGLQDTVITTTSADTIALHDSTQFASKGEQVIRNREYSLRVLNEFIDRMQHNLPYLLWLSLPLFAVVLKLLYIRKKIYYYDHAVFSLYLYAFNFLLITVAVMLTVLWRWMHIPSRAINYINLGFLCCSAGYVFFSMKNFYRQRYGKTMLKFALLTFTGLFMALLMFVLFAVIISPSLPKME